MSIDLTNTFAFIGLTAIIGLLTNMAIVSLASGETARHSGIFVSDCDSRDTLAAYVAAQKTYAPYLGSYDVICFPSARDVMSVPEYVTVIRTVYPDDNLVFTFDLRQPTQILEFKAFLGTTDSYNHDK